MSVMAWKWWITLNPNTGEAEAGWCLSLRPTWPTEPPQRNLLLKNQTNNKWNVSFIVSCLKNWNDVETLTDMCWLFTPFIDEFLFIFRFMLLGFYFIFLVSFVLMWQTVLHVELCFKPSTLTFAKTVVEKLLPLVSLGCELVRLGSLLRMFS